jgi:hypothetical protein
MQPYKKFLAFTVLFAALLVALPSEVSAQGKVSFRLSPTTIEDKVDPGADRDFALNIENQGDATATLYPSAQNITGIGPDLHPIYSSAKDTEGYALASWITYQEKELVVRPHEQKTLHFTVHFPKDAHPGSHMAGVFLSDKPSDATQSGSSIGFQIGAIVNFQVAGEIIEDTQIREFYTTKAVYSNADVGFTTKLENRGNILSRPHGLIDITNMFGKKVASIPVNDNGGGIFPNGVREFSSVWKSDDIQLGRYDAVVALAVEGQNGTQTISRVLQFWIMPMNIIGPIVGGLLFLIILVYVIIRLYIRSQLAGISRPRGASRRSDPGLSKSAAIVIALLVAIIIGFVILFFYFG